MSVNSKMIAIADKIRALLGISGAMGLDAMAENLGTEQINVTNAFAAVGSKGGTVPTSKVSGNLADAIQSIPESSEEVPALQSKSAAPSETAQTIYPDTGYDGLSSVEVGAISSTYVGSGVTRKNAATITPGTNDQTIAAGQYLSGAQTIKGDANLKAENIKSGVSVFGVAGTASSGVTVQRKAGSFTTNSSGEATVNCGFRPDVLLITGLYDSNYTSEYHAACVFPEQTNSSYDLTMAAAPDNYGDGIEFYPTRTTNGFSVEVWENNVALGDWYTLQDVTFSYVAIKYTA